MATHKKRKFSQEVSDGSEDPEDSSSEDSQSDSEEGEESDSQSEQGSEVNVDLEFFDPKEADFQGLKSLLHLFLDGKEYDCSGLADVIIKQSTVGSVVKTGMDGDPLGIITILNTQRYGQQQCMLEILDFLKHHSPSPDHAARLHQAWQARGTGLMIAERLANCPPQLAPPLIQSAFEEVHWALEDEPTQELRESFNFNCFIIASRVYEDEDVEAPSSSSKQQNGAAAAATKKIVYVRPEDQFFHQHADWSYIFPVAGRTTDKNELRQLRIVMCLKPAKLKVARNELDRTVGNPVASIAAA